MARLIFQYLTIYDNKILPKSIQIGSQLCQITNKPWKYCQRFIFFLLNWRNFAKSGHIARELNYKSKNGNYPCVLYFAVKSARQSQKHLKCSKNCRRQKVCLFLSEIFSTKITFPQNWSNCEIFNCLWHRLILFTSAGHHAFFVYSCRVCLFYCNWRSAANKY